MRAFDPRTIPVRFTHLRQMSRSPAHYLQSVRAGRPDSPAMRIGRMVHARLFGRMSDDDEGDLVVYDGKRQGKAWTTFEEEHPNDEIVTIGEYERVEPIALAVLADPVAAQFIGTRAEHEKQIEWRIGDRACTSRPDVLGRASFGMFLNDLKTTGISAPFEFQRHALKMQWHTQSSFYRAAAAFSGVDVVENYVTAVEVNPPYAVTVHRLSADLLDHGRRAWLAWFERLRVCEESDQWPGYAQACVPWEPPAWMNDDDADDEDEASA